MNLIPTALAATLLATTVMAAGPAGAETLTRSDPQPECSQAAPLDVKRATFTYTAKVFKTRIRMSDLRKKDTQVLTRFDIGDSSGDTYGVLLASRYRAGKLRTVGHWSDYEAEDYWNRFTSGVTATWNWDKNTVTFRLTRHLRGQDVSAAAYSVPKGASHGPDCGDYVYVGSLKRG